MSDRNTLMTPTPTVRVMDAAIVPILPVRPKRALVISMAALLGLMLSMGAAYARETMNSTVRTKAELQAFTGVRVLGLIPRIPRGSAELRARRFALNRLLRSWQPTTVRGRRPAAALPTGRQEWIRDRVVAGADPRSPVSEAYRSLRTNITFGRTDRVSKTLVFTSAMPGDGKTTSAANLAVTLAQQGVRILLVDGDLRRGVLNTVFSTPREPGLSNILLGAAKTQDGIRSIDLGDNGSFDFMSSGTLPPNPAELLGSQKMRQLLSELEGKYDAILLDSPPLNVVTDAAVLGTVADGVVLVATSKITDLLSVRKGDIIVGINGVRIKNKAQYYYQMDTAPSPKVDLIVWSHGSYCLATADLPDHRLGAQIRNFQPAEER